MRYSYEFKRKKRPIICISANNRTLLTDVSYRNRTYNLVLGGPCYIHLTNETKCHFPLKTRGFLAFR